MAAGLTMRSKSVPLMYPEASAACASRRPASTCSTVSGCAASAACEIFASAGAAAFADRARTELRATGERAPKRTAQTHDVLTAREAHIARLAGQGVSNAEIAVQLYISPATVVYHLRKVFATLGISSPNQLAAALPAHRDLAQPVKCRAKRLLGRLLMLLRWSANSESWSSRRAVRGRLGSRWLRSLARVQRAPGTTGHREWALQETPEMRRVARWLIVVTAMAGSFRLGELDHFSYSSQAV